MANLFNRTVPRQTYLTEQYPEDPFTEMSKIVPTDRESCNQINEHVELIYPNPPEGDHPQYPRKFFASAVCILPKSYTDIADR